MQRPPEALLQTLLAETAVRHHHLCPRQVLGVRMGLLGLRLLGLADEGYQPRFLNNDKRLLTFVETDGCGADGVAVAVSCAVGRRTLRVVDFGKMAAVLVDTATGTAVRLAPHPLARQHAQGNGRYPKDRWQNYLQAYQTLPDESLFTMQPVKLIQSANTFISTPTARAICGLCGEEIMNEREVFDEKQRVLCRYCAGERYYQ